MDFEEQLRQLAERISRIRKDIATEEATKTSMVMPFFQTLGYDVFNPLEFIPEYVADVGLKKGEKVDYAIIDENKKPIILVEAKNCGVSLDKYGSQLFRYFSTTPASKVAILTNGIEYRFYMDLEEENKMDTTPFYSFNIFELNNSTIQFLEKYRKTSFNIANIRATASELTYNSQIKQILSQQLVEPDDEFINYFLPQIYDGKRTKKAINQFRDIVKKSFVQFINDKVNERINNALNSSDSPQQNDLVQVDNKPQAEVKETGKIPTDEEVEGFLYLQKMLESKLKGHLLTYKCTSNYFAIGIDDNYNKWVCRFAFGAEKLIFLPLPHNGKPFTKRKIRDIKDIGYYEHHLADILEKYVGKC